MKNGTAMRAIVIATLLVLGGPAVAQSLVLEAPDRGGSVTISLDLPIASQPLTVHAEFTFSVQAAEIRLRPTATAGSYTTVSGSPVGGNDQLYEATIPGELISSRGVEFYLSYLADGVVTTIPEVDPEGSPLRYPVLTPRIRADVNLVPRRYAMISIPFQFDEGLAPGMASGSLDAIFADDYGEYHPNRWRVLRWNTQEEAYDEGDAAVPQVRPAEGFWLITSSGAEFDVEGGITPGFQISGSSVGEAPETVIAYPGWTQVGNPFLYPISWDEVDGSTLLEPPVGFSGQAYEPGQTTLEPWTGYFVFNPGPQAVEVAISTPQSSAPARTERSFADLLLNEPSGAPFIIQVAAASGDLEDEHAYLVGGTSDVELRKPPAMGESPRVAVLSSGSTYFVRSTPASFGPWTVEVGASVGERPTTVRLTPHGTFPPGAVIEVQDAATGSHVLAPGGTFDLPAGHEAQRFTVQVVASDEASVPSPEERLAQPYPNPAVGGQTVSTFVWGNEDSTIEMFDLLGRRVRTLGDSSSGSGWQSLVIDLVDQGGRPLPAGMYLLRYHSAEGVSTQVITIIR